VISTPKNCFSLAPIFWIRPCFKIMRLLGYSWNGCSRWACWWSGTGLTYVVVDRRAYAVACVVPARLRCCGVDSWRLTDKAWSHTYGRVLTWSQSSRIPPARLCCQCQLAFCTIRDLQSAFCAEGSSSSDDDVLVQQTLVVPCRSEAQGRVDSCCCSKPKFRCFDFMKTSRVVSCRCAYSTISSTRHTQHAVMEYTWQFWTCRRYGSTCHWLTVQKSAWSLSSGIWPICCRNKARKTVDFNCG